MNFLTSSPLIKSNNGSSNLAFSQQMTSRFKENCVDFSSLSNFCPAISHENQGDLLSPQSHMLLSNSQLSCSSNLEDNTFCDGDFTHLSANSNSSILRTRRRKAGISEDEKLCVVCGEFASGYNFDQLTCESCKAFFRRNAVKSRDKIKPCTRDNNCEIYGSQRKHCPSCRLEKCYRSGMRKELILPPEKLETRAKPKRRCISVGSNLNLDGDLNLQSDLCDTGNMCKSKKYNSGVDVLGDSPNPLSVQHLSRHHFPMNVPSHISMNSTSPHDNFHNHLMGTSFEINMPSKINSSFTNKNDNTNTLNCQELLAGNFAQFDLNNRHNLSFIGENSHVTDSTHSYSHPQEIIKLPPNHLQLVSSAINTFSRQISSNFSSQSLSHHPFNQGNPQLVSQQSNSLLPNNEIANQPLAYAQWTESLSIIRRQFVSGLIMHIGKDFDREEINSNAPGDYPNDSEKMSLAYHHQSNPEMSAEDLCNKMSRIITSITHLAKHIPGFRELPFHFQACLLKKNVFGLILVTCSFHQESDHILVDLSLMQSRNSKPIDKSYQQGEIFKNSHSGGRRGSLDSITTPSSSSSCSDVSTCLPNSPHIQSSLLQAHHSKLTAIACELEKCALGDDLLRACLFAIRLFSCDSDLGPEMISSVKLAQFEIIKFLRRYLDSILSVNCSTSLYLSRMLLALAHCRPHEARLRAFTEFLRSDQLVPLMREVFLK